MKKIITFFLILSIGIFGISLAETKTFEAIKTEDFKKQIENSTVIDIRTDGEWAEGKITKEALEIDFYQTEKFKTELNKLDKNEKYLIYCRSGSRTLEAKGIMKDLGFKFVSDLDGGINTWDGELFINIDRNEVVKEYLGKPTVVLIAGTFCPHCQTDVPEVEEKIWNKIGDGISEEKVNLVVNVTDGEDGKRFKTTMNQVSDPLLNFKVLTGEECLYVPSWVVLDKEGKVSDKSCGNQKGNEGLISSLKKLDVTFDKVRIETEKKEEENIWILILVLLGVIAGGYWAFKK